MGRGERRSGSKLKKLATTEAAETGGPGEYDRWR